MQIIEANGAKILAIGLGTWELRGRACARLAGMRLGRIPSLSRPDQGARGVRAKGPRCGRLQPGGERPDQERLDASRDRPRPRQDRRAGVSALAGATKCFCDSADVADRTAIGNIDIFDFALSDEEMSRISGMGSAKGQLTDFGFAPKWD
jgi:hypothetical protein